MSEDDFRVNFPTVRAATILTPEAAEVAGLLDAVRNPEKDTLAAERAELKEHLLGPSDPPSSVRFNQAALALCTKADERRIRMENRLSGIPGQRSQEDVDTSETAENQDNGASDATAAV